MSLPQTSFCSTCNMIVPFLRHALLKTTSSSCNLLFKQATFATTSITSPRLRFQLLLILISTLQDPLPTFKMIYSPTMTNNQTIPSQPIILTTSTFLQDQAGVQGTHLFPNVASSLQNLSLMWETFLIISTPSEWYVFPFFYLIFSH